MNFSICPHQPMTTLLFAACFATGCTKRMEPPVPVVPQAVTTASDASSQPSLLGTVPAGTSKDTPATISGAKSDVSKAQQSDDMPMPGQANDHSTLAPHATQKANTKNR